MVSKLERINRELNLTILCVDHTRKPQGQNTHRSKQEPNPFDLKGSVAKYGAADFMLCLSRTEQPGRLQFYAENKDTDERPHFFIDISPRDSGKPKFQWAGDIEKFANDMKVLGDENRKKVLTALADNYLSTADVAKRAGLQESTTRKHLAALLESDEVDRSGQARASRWFRKSAEANKTQDSGFRESDYESKN